MYNDGYGVAQDYAEAVRWYRLSADQGNTEAQTYLGTLYFNGLGVAQNIVRKWFRGGCCSAGQGRNQYDRRPDR
jgi:TPR repeat protein